jgi:hypothetical protein
VALSAASGLAAALLLAAAAERAAPPEPAQIEFTEGVIPFSQLSAFSWQTWLQLFPLNAKKYPVRVVPGTGLEFLASDEPPSMVTPGSVETLDVPVAVAPGSPLFHLRVKQSLNAERTERQVSLAVSTHANQNILSFDFKSSGTALEEIPDSALLMGYLPFFPGENESVAVTTIVFLDSDRVRTTIRRERAGDLDYFEVFIAQGKRDNPFLMYREWSSPLIRRFSYHMTMASSGNADEWDWTRGTTLEAIKVRRPGDAIGSETFRIDHLEVGMSTYQATFNQVVLNLIAQSWKGGFGSFAGYMFMPGFYDSASKLFQ